MVVMDGQKVVMDGPKVFMDEPEVVITFFRTYWPYTLEFDLALHF
jgi:hypothetical protein